MKLTHTALFFITVITLSGCCNYQRPNIDILLSETIEISNPSAMPLAILEIRSTPDSPYRFKFPRVSVDAGGRINYQITEESYLGFSQGEFIVQAQCGGSETVFGKERFKIDSKALDSHQPISIDPVNNSVYLPGY
ncbi:hypothetical protein O5O45_13940 [Hahella aquimaris]|uniref:hypothetical protein n=1 Tax=Hahella sp. HNIBRBA332 TaxID=3015983 RepID=UPI00273CCADA|nr:hypothetical protein [Hahella sp. HNIBRBA332]WLQ17016.1 hypothetical protein O5O45_13940 [Hahella sp. HNIBRBA332]